MNHQLRDRLRRIDPMRSGAPTEPPTTESSRRLLEEIMSTPVKDPSREISPVRRNWLMAATAVAALALVVGGVATLTGGDPDPVAAEPLVLSTGESGVIASCLPLDAEYLASMPMAFEATAVSVEGDEVVLDVDRWFRGGEATQVILRAPQGFEALIDGFAFEAGARYLISASEGTVNYCGFSGLATPELRAVYDEAFGG